MKKEYKRSAYRRWKKKGLIEQAGDLSYLLKNGQKIKLSFEGKKVFLNEDDETETVELPKTPYRNPPEKSFFAKKSGVIQID